MQRIGEMEGNPADSVYNIAFKDIIATAVATDLKTRYRGIKFENVVVNGVPFVIK